MLSASTLPSAQARLLEELSEELRALDDRALRRRLTVVDRIDGPWVEIGGRRLISWCSNDYLGLSAHPALAEAAASAARDWGVGARASRLLAGSTRWHARLEEALAAWFATDAAIVYPSGYLANLGTLGALLSSRDVAFVDRLAHASLIDAVRRTPATLRVFRHNDLSHLAMLLSRAGGARRRLVVTEGIFSMEGDACPLAGLAELADSHDTLLYLDDAHGAFVTGATGRGTPEAAGVPHERFLYMATLGKGLGAQGGFVAGPSPLIDYLHSRAGAFLYTTALAVPVAAAAAAALRVLAEEPARREVLRRQAARLQERLASLRLPGAADRTASHILPLILGEAERAVEVARRLWDRGCWAPAIRPPTVPEGTARLRLSVTALHTDAHIDMLIDALADVIT
ncbi:MAG: 8-amino-7-oxononanoate synthase [Candidatus Omnitrophica bacterium]|nr:8-amino-7-oxononanoate synthase [Candidatus Omnitrophota bacterium]